MKKKLCVILPSREQPSQKYFLDRAISSIESQTIIGEFEVDVIVGVDRGQAPINIENKKVKIDFVESDGASQAAALNACVRIADSDYVGFLEDDDTWHPLFLANAMEAISIVSFVSSTQLEWNENGQILRVNDFATPSGWFMSYNTLRAVGEFNEQYKFHLDNEWLGRLCEVGTERIHLVELTAPIEFRLMQKFRPQLANVMKNSGALLKVARHDLALPLVNRLVHSMSGMARISSTPSLKRISQKERKKLVERFGRIPY